MPTGLTQQQHKVLSFIKGFIGQNGYSPSHLEIGIGVGLSSLATVNKHLKQLEKRGHISRTAGMARSISLTIQ